MHVLVEHTPVGLINRLDVEQEYAGECLQIGTVLHEVFHRALGDLERPRAAARIGVESRRHERGFIGNIRQHEDLEGRPDLEDEKTLVVPLERVGSSTQLDLAGVEVAVLHAGRRRERHLFLAVRRDRDALLAFLDAVDLEFDKARRRILARRANASPDLDGLSLGGSARRGSGRIDVDVLNLLGRQPQDKRGDLDPGLAILGLGKTVEPFSGQVGVPRRARQIGEHIDHAHRALAFGDRRIDLAHHRVERPIDHPDGQAIDPLGGRRRREPHRCGGLSRIDDENEARARESSR